MSNSFANAALFLINTLFDMYLLILIIRLILCGIRADYFNPISQFIVKATRFFVIPLRRILPTIKNIELSTLFLVILFELIKFFLIGIVIVGKINNPLGLLILAAGDALKLFFNVFFYAILLQAVMSWLNPGYSPAARLIDQMTAPLMRPIRRFCPTIGGFDLSPIPALILLQLMIILLANPIIGFGAGVAFG